MALSGNYELTMSAADLITEAFKLAGVVPAEQELQSFELADGLIVLNMLTKEWQIDGMHLWPVNQGVVFLTPGQPGYALGPTGDYACLDEDFISTQTSDDLSMGSFIISVEDTTGMLAGDYVGINNGTTRQWSIIDSVDSATQITIEDALIADVDSGNSVFTFTNKIQRPLRISAARRIYWQTNNTDQPNLLPEIDISVWSKNKYYEQVYKNLQGIVSAIYYWPKLTNGVLYTWQTTSTFDQYLKFTFEMPLQIVDLNNQSVDFPQEWYNCIIYNVASGLGDRGYSIPAEKQAKIDAKAEALHAALKGWDEEQVSLQIIPRS